MTLSPELSKALPFGGSRNDQRHLLWKAPSKSGYIFIIYITHLVRTVDIWNVFDALVKRKRHLKRMWPNNAISVRRGWISLVILMMMMTMMMTMTTDAKKTRNSYDVSQWESPWADRMLCIQSLRNVYNSFYQEIEDKILLMRNSHFNILPHLWESMIKVKVPRIENCIFFYPGAHMPICFLLLLLKNKCEKI